METLSCDMEPIYKFVRICLENIENRASLPRLPQRQPHQRIQSRGVAQLRLRRRHRRTRFIGLETQAGERAQGIRRDAARRRNSAPAPSDSNRR